jgi:signal transduction histidine kinase
MHRTEKAGRVSQVMRSLLDVMRSETGTLRIHASPCRPADLVTEAITHVTRAANEKELVLDGLVGEVGEVACDRGRIVEVIAQLLANAIEASPRGGAVVVRATARDRDVVVSVADGGCGIDAAEWPFLFDGAWQSPDHGHRKGLGLGLALARAIVRAHGGNIWADSRRNEGSVFAFSLPRS